MLQHVLEKVLGVFQQVVLCVPENETELAASGVFGQAFLADFAGRIHLCPVADARHGLSRSLAGGVAYVEQHFDCDGVMVLLADMPFIQPSTLGVLLQAFEPGAIVYPCKGTVDSSGAQFSSAVPRQGHPVVFARDFFQPLKQQQGDKGGKAVIEQHPSKVIAVRVEDAGIYRDVDIQDDVVFSS